MDAKSTNGASISQKHASSRPGEIQEQSCDEKGRCLVLIHSSIPGIAYAWDWGQVPVRVNGDILQAHAVIIQVVSETFSQSGTSAMARRLRLGCKGPSKDQTEGSCDTYEARFSFLKKVGTYPSLDRQSEVEFG